MLNEPDHHHIKMEHCLASLNRLQIKIDICLKYYSIATDSTMTQPGMQLYLKIQQQENEWA